MPMKKTNRILSLIIYGFAGAAIGRFLISYLHYRSNPFAYLPYSAPWYFQALPCALISAAVIVIAIVIKLIIRYKTR